MENTFNNLPDFFFSNVSRNEIISFASDILKPVISEPKPSYIKCSCGSDKVWIDNMQTRSGDEGYTCFFLCSSCKKKWTAS